MRCSQDGGFLHHAYITHDGIAVYRCMREDHYNDKGRYFVLTVEGPVEVLPKVVARGKDGVDWGYELVDVAGRRAKEETARINAELERRSKLYRNNMAVLFEKARYQRKYGREEEE